MPWKSQSCRFVRCYCFKGIRTINVSLPFTNCCKAVSESSWWEEWTNTFLYNALNVETCKILLWSQSDCKPKGESHANILNLHLWEVLFPANLLVPFFQTADMLGSFSNLQRAISVLQTENKEKWQQDIKYKLIPMPLFRREAANKIIGRLVTTSKLRGVRVELEKLIWFQFYPHSVKMREEL